MAITLGEALVYLTADDKGLDKTLEGAKTKTTSWAASLGTSVAGLVGSAVVAGAAAATAAIIGIAAAAVSVASKVDQSQRDMQTQLGLTAAEAENLANVTRRVYGDNFTGSIEEAGQAVTNTLLTLGSAADGLANDELARLTEQGLALSDAFGIDLNESMRSASILVRTGVAKDFDDAMNIITAGFQNGLNASNDLLDTLNEYADDFADMGLTGEEVLGMLNRGLEAGAFNTDKLADALNEFGVRLRDPAVGDKVREIDAGIAGLYEEFQAGNITERDALEGMLARIAAIEDPIKRDQAGVALFGSMWEDLGEKAILAMGGIEDGTISTADATESLNVQYDNFGNMLEGIKRRAVLALEPLGEKLLEIANKIMPYVEAAFAWLEEKAPQWLETFRAWWADKIAPALEKITDWWNSTGKEAFGLLKDAIVALFSGDTETAWNNLLAAIDLIFGEGTSEKINSIRQDIEDWAADWKDRFNETKATIVDWWAQNVKPVIEEIKAWFVKNWPEISDTFVKAWDAIKAAAMAVVSVIVSSVWPPIKSALDSIGKVFADNGITITDVLDALWNGVKITAEGIGGIIAVLVALLLGHFTGLANAFEAVVGTFIELGSSFETFFEGLIELFAGAFGVIKGIVELDGELIMQGFQLMGDGIFKIATSSLEALSTMIIGAGAAILEYISGFTEGFFGFFKELFENLGIDVPDWLNNIVEAFHNIDWWALGQSLIDGIKNGFTEGFNGWIDEVGNQVNDLLNQFKKEAEVESPSKLMSREVGEPLARGIIQGYESTMALEMSNVLATSMNSIGQQVNWLVDDLKGVGQRAFDKDKWQAFQAGGGFNSAITNMKSDSQVNITVHADSQTNGQKVGDAAADAYLSRVRSIGQQV